MPVTMPETVLVIAPEGGLYWCARPEPAVADPEIFPREFAVDLDPGVRHTSEGLVRPPRMVRARMEVVHHSPRVGIFKVTCGPEAWDRLTAYGGFVELPMAELLGYLSAALAEPGRHYCAGRALAMASHDGRFSPATKLLDAMFKAADGAR